LIHRKILQSRFSW